METITKQSNNNVCTTTTNYQRYCAAKASFGQESGSEILCQSGAGLSTNEKPRKIQIVGSTQKEDSTSLGLRDIVYGEDGVIGALLATDYKAPKQVARLKQVVGGAQGDRVYDPDGIAATLLTSINKTGMYQVAPVLTPDRVNKRQNDRRMKDNDEPSFTLTTQDRHGVAVYDDYNSKWKDTETSCTLTTNCGSQSQRNGQKVLDGVSIRRLTPTECEKLQAFPVGWTELGENGEKISDSQRYKMMGNAVTTSAVAAVMDSILRLGLEL